MVSEFKAATERDRLGSDGRDARRRCVVAAATGGGDGEKGEHVRAGV